MNKKTEIQLGAAARSANPGNELVHQLLGQVQMAAAFANFSRAAMTSKLKLVKENKIYQQLKGMVTPSGSELKGTWEDFCSLLGMSADKADEDIKNLTVFGEEAFEQMNRAGVGFRDFRQYRNLPADAQLELIEAAKTGDKELLMDLAEQLISRQTQEKKQLNEDLTAAKEAFENAQTAAETAEMERDQLQDQLQQATKPMRKSARPLLVEDIQQETAVQVIAHDLALSRLQEQLHDASGLQGGALQEWAAATQGTVFAAIVAAHAKTCALLQSAIDAGLATTDYSGMAVTAALSDAALDSVVSRAADLLRVEDYEKRLRAWQREQDRPRSKGRPMAKPELAE